MLPKHRLPSEYEPSVLHRIVEDLYSRVDKAFANVDNVRLYADTKLNDLKKSVGNLGKSVSKLEKRTAKQKGVPIPEVSVSHWGRLVFCTITNVHKFKRWRVGAFYAFEWHMSSDSSALDYPDESTFVRYTLTGKILMLSPNVGTHYVRVRAVGIDGDVHGQWSEIGSTSTIDFGGASEDTEPPSWSNDNAQLTFSGTIYRVWHKFTRRANAAVSWLLATDDQTAQSDVANYIVRYRISGEDDEKWRYQIFPGQSYGLKNDGTHGYAVLRGLVENKTYEMNIQARDKANNKTEWRGATAGSTDPVTFTVDEDSTAPDPSQVGYVRATESPYVGTDWGKFGFRHAYQAYGISVTDAESQNVRTVHIRYRNTSRQLWRHEIVELGDLEQVPKSELDGSADSEMYYVVRLAPLAQDETFEIEVKYTNWWFQRSSFYSWGNFTTQKSDVLDMSAISWNDTSTYCYARWHGPLSRTPWRLHLQWTNPSGGAYDSQVAKKYQVKFAKQVRGTWRFWTRTFHDPGQAGSVEECDYPAFFRPDTNVLDQDSGFYVNIRAWYHGEYGTDYANGHWTTSDPSTDGWKSVPIGELDDESVATPPTPQVTHVHWRFIRLNPDPNDTYDYPDSFAKWIVHASTDPNFTPDTTGFTDVVHAGALARIEDREFMIFVPFRVSDGAGGKVWVPTRKIDSDVYFKTSVWTWKKQVGAKPKMTALSTTSSSVQLGSQIDLFEDLFASNFFTKRKLIAVFGGDVLYAPSVKIREYVSSTETNIWVDNVDEGAAEILNPGDICVIGKSGRSFGVANSDVFAQDVELIKIDTFGATHNRLNVTRNYRSQAPSGEVAHAGDLLIKVGEEGSTYTFTWTDAENDSIRVIRTNDDGSWSTDKVVEYGYSGADAFYARFAYIETAKNVGTSSKGVKITSNGIYGYNAFLLNTFSIDAATGLAKFAGSGHEIDTGDGSSPNSVIKITGGGRGIGIGEYGGTDMIYLHADGTINLGTPGAAINVNEGAINIAAANGISVGTNGSILLYAGGFLSVASNSYIGIDADRGIRIHSGGSLIVQNGGNMQIQSGGTLTVVGSQGIQVGTGGSIDIQSNGAFNVTGGTVSIASEGTFSVESDGIFTVDSGNAVVIQSSDIVAIQAVSGGKVQIVSNETLNVLGQADTWIQGNEKITIVSSSDVQISGYSVGITSGTTDITLDADDDVTINGDNINLNRGTSSGILTSNFRWAQFLPGSTYSGFYIGTKDDKFGDLVFGTNKLRINGDEGLTQNVYFSSVNGLKFVHGICVGTL